MSRTKKINNLKQTHGKNEDIKTPKTLDELFSNTYTKYTAKSLEEYKSQLESMNSADIREHAVKMGFMPSPDTNRLKKKLLSEFEKFESANNLNSRPKLNNLSSPSKEALDIMSAVK